MGIDNYLKMSSFILNKHSAAELSSSHRSHVMDKQGC